MGGKRVKDEEKTKKQKEREHSKRGKDCDIVIFNYFNEYFSTLLKKCRVLNNIRFNTMNLSLRD